MAVRLAAHIFDLEHAIIKERVYRELTVCGIGEASLVVWDKLFIMFSFGARQMPAVCQTLTVIKLKRGRLS